MHSVYFVVLPTSDAYSPEQAIEAATSFLDDNGFAGDGGVFSPPRADWYQVGGRWSGILTELQPWYEEFRKEAETLLKTEFPELTSGIEGVWYGAPEERAKAKEARGRIHSLWEKMRPKEVTVSCPMLRSTLLTEDDRKDGCLPADSPDNAMLITPELLRGLRQHWNEVEMVDTDEGFEYMLADREDEELLGRWIVVIDCHN